MTSSLQLPESDAWAHGVHTVNECAAESWEAALANAAARSSEPEADQDATVLRTVADLVIDRVVAWAPGKNGQDPAEALEEALEGAGFSAAKASQVAAVWQQQGKALTLRARASAIARLTGRAADDAAGAGHIRYVGAGVKVGEGHLATEAEEMHVESDLHVPLATIALPRDARGDTCRLSLGSEAAYELFAEIDRVQRQVDSLFESAASPSA